MSISEQNRTRCMDPMRQSSEYRGPFYTNPRQDDFDQYTEDEDQTVVSDIQEVTIRDSFIGFSRCDKDDFMRFQLGFGVNLLKTNMSCLHCTDR